MQKRVLVCCNLHIKQMLTGYVCVWGGGEQDKNCTIFRAGNMCEKVFLICGKLHILG